MHIALQMSIVSSYSPDSLRIKAFTHAHYIRFPVIKVYVYDLVKTDDIPCIPLTNVKYRFYLNGLPIPAMGFVNLLMDLQWSAKT